MFIVMGLLLTYLLLMLTMPVRLNSLTIVNLDLDRKAVCQYQEGVQKGTHHLKRWLRKIIIS